MRTQGSVKSAAQVDRISIAELQRHIHVLYKSPTDIGELEGGIPYVGWRMGRDGGTTAVAADTLGYFRLSGKPGKQSFRAETVFEETTEEEMRARLGVLGLAVQATTDWDLTDFAKWMAANPKGAEKTVGDKHVTFTWKREANHNVLVVNVERAP